MGGVVPNRLAVGGQRLTWPALRLAAAVVACVVVLGRAGLAGDHVTVTYRKGFLIDTVSGEVVKHDGDVLVLSAWKEGVGNDLSIPFDDLREINGEPAVLVIARWRKERAEAEAREAKAAKEPKSGQQPSRLVHKSAEEKSTGEMLTMVYRDLFSVKTIRAELLDRGGEFITVRVGSGGKKHVITILRSDVKTINNEPASRIFARWDKVSVGNEAEAAASAVSGPPVRLKYRDGFAYDVLSGMLVSRDMRRVVVRAMVDGQLQDIAMPWKQIKEYNGRRADKEYDRFRRENKKRLCLDCKGGTVVVKCDRCVGTGWISDVWENCRVCGGTGQIECRSSSCTDGYTECPGPCLKLSKGKWKKNWDGKYWIKFRYAKEKYMAFSEEKIGQVVKRVDGVPRIVGPCTVCGGKGKIPCKVCEGANKRVCPACEGRKKMPSRSNARKCSHCVDGVVPCEKCGGAGILPEKKEGEGKDKDKGKSE